MDLNWIHDFLLYIKNRLYENTELKFGEIKRNNRVFCPKDFITDLSVKCISQPGSFPASHLYSKLIQNLAGCIEKVQFLETVFDYYED